MIEFTEVKKLLAAPNPAESRNWRVKALSIAKGERVLISGPSGCGKTTFLNLLAGLLHPETGSITVNAVRVDQLRTSQADVFRGGNIGLIFQSLHLLTPFTVLDNVLLGARFGRKWKHHEALERAKALLGEVGLSERLKARPHRLSLGEQQRVAIARALINEPCVLLADEPTSSLDAANTGKVLDLLFQLCDTHHTTLVMVSHDTSSAERFDRMIDAADWIVGNGKEASYARH
jgi:ABC-type lipoprotein export system ATPase subunit